MIRERQAPFALNLGESGGLRRSMSGLKRELAHDLQETGSREQVVAQRGHGHVLVTSSLPMTPFALSPANVVSASTSSTLAREAATERLMSLTLLLARTRSESRSRARRKCGFGRRVVARHPQGSGNAELELGVDPLRSVRAEKPFVAIHCSAIRETLMEAELFGHENGALTNAKQMKKGRSEAADCGRRRLMSPSSPPPTATWRKPSAKINSGRLYYRLAIIAMFIPPLHDRKEDILPLVDFFINR